MIVGIGVLGYLLFFYISKLRGIFMKLQVLKLHHFRNYDQLSIMFNPHLNIIYGKNGVGKTNLIESIYVLAITRTFRNVNEKVLISINSSLAKVEGKILNEKRQEDTYSIYLTKEGKKVKINNNKVIKISDYITKIPIVLFNPDDLKMIKDTPNTRRKQLNIAISQYNVNYLKDLTIYKKIMKQRNSYLKKLVVNSNQSFDYLDILTDKLINYGLKIFEERKKFVDFINENLENLYENITNLSGLKIVYKSDYDNCDVTKLKKNYQKMLQKDLTFGKTNIGIHTDDLEFLIDDNNLKDYGSEGQQKNAVVAFKLCELLFLKTKLNFAPILILDDIFSELDKEKIQNIFKLLTSDMQIFITTTELDFLNDINLKNYKTIEISSGKVEKERDYE